MTVGVEAPRTFQSDVPARLDRLPWSRWHWMVVAALGITWIIDGLEVTMIASFSAVLQEPESLHFSGTQIGLLNSSYLAGAVIGALVFGYLTDRLGRKKLFTVTLGLYLVSAFLTAVAWDFWSFALFRFLTGAAIGGEYSAINSAIDELIPSRVRGWADLAINGTFWVGAAAGSLASIVLLDPSRFAANLGWRLGFGIMPEPLAKHMTALVNNSNSCTATFVQMAGESALTGPQDDVHAMLAEFRARREVIVDGLNAIPGVTCTRPAGAFYAFPRLDCGGLSSVQLADQLLEQAGVVTIPGTGFGAFGERHLRLSYANSRENLREGLRRMAEHLAPLARR